MVNKKINHLLVIYFLSLVIMFPLPLLAGEASLKKTVDSIVVPTVFDVLSTAQELHLQSKRFCEQPTKNKLLLVQDRFFNVDEAWMKNEAFLLGPAVVDHHIDLSVNFWPTRKSTIIKVLNDDVDISLEQLNHHGISATGLPVIEYLLFNDFVDVGVFIEEPRRCDYLVSVTEHLVIQVMLLKQQWDSDGAFYTAFLHKKNHQESLALTINKIAQLSASIVKKKIDPALNNGREKVQPYKLRSWRSESSVVGISANLNILKTLLLSESSVTQLIQNNDSKVSLLHDLDVMFHDLDAIQMDIKRSLFEQIQDDPELIDHWRSQIVFLDLVIRERLAPELGVSLGFNDADGD